MSDSIKPENSIILSIERKKNLLRSVLFKIFDWIYTKSFFGILQNIPRRFVKFLFVCAINTLFGYSMYALFVTFGFNPSNALLISYILGVFWNFKTTGSIVFRNKDNKLIFKFFISYVFTFSVNNFFLNFLMNNLHLNKYLAQLILVLPVAVLSFTIFKTFIFVDKK